jgi:hypothetical protein
MICNHYGKRDWKKIARLKMENRNVFILNGLQSLITAY